ncbi:MAG: uracil-DNA glycosylase [Actinomycetota bacterium]|nr:uracil-DNA glycosylase [Actinomycetota bacterium]
MDKPDKREKLKELYLDIRDCQRCGLCKSRTKFVFGSGSAYAEVMFVGEAPGKNEDLQGLPFVGQAGKLLDELLGSIGFDRSEVFIANVLKCRPPGNRDPRIEEINVCKDHLMGQIKVIDPKIICTLGKFSTQLLLNTDKGITGLRGKVFRIDNHIIMPINHPAAALYMPSKMEILKQDFQKIKKLLDSASEVSDSEQDISSLEPEDNQDKDEQLGLF